MLVEGEGGREGEKEEGRWKEREANLMADVSFAVFSVSAPAVASESMSSPDIPWRNGKKRCA